MAATRPGLLGKTRHIRSFGFVRRLLCEARVVLLRRGGDQTQREPSGDRPAPLHNTDLFDWIALRRADASSVSMVGRGYFDGGRQAPCYLPAAFARLVEAGLLERVEQHPGRVRVVLTALGRTRFDELSRRAAVRN